RGHHIRSEARPLEKAGRWHGNARLGRSNLELHGDESNCTERAIFPELVGTLVDCAQVDRVRARLPKCGESVQLYLGFEDDEAEKKISEYPGESATPRTQCNKFDHDDKQPRASRYPSPGATADHNDGRR